MHCRPKRRRAGTCGGGRLTAGGPGNASAPIEFFSGPDATLAANYLFETDDAAEKLSPQKAKRFYTHVMQGMWLAKRGRPDALLPVAYLSTRVKNPDVNDWKKLGRLMRYFEATKDLPP